MFKSFEHNFCICSAEVPPAQHAYFCRAKPLDIFLINQNIYLFLTSNTKHQTDHTNCYVRVVVTTSNFTKLWRSFRLLHYGTVRKGNYMRIHNFLDRLQAKQPPCWPPSPPLSIHPSALDIPTGFTTRWKPTSRRRWWMKSSTTKLRPTDGAP